MRFLFLLFPLSAAAAQVLNVTIVDYANVPPGTLAGAGQVLTEIYRTAGSQLRLHVQTEEWRPDEPTGLDGVSGDIVLRICSAEMARKLIQRDSVLGYVQPTALGELRRVATVFFHRVEMMNEATQTDTARLLGAVLAHETGHLLLGRRSHSPQGIMRCPWDTEELIALRQGRLRFDRRQAESIVREIEARTTAGNRPLRSAGPAKLERR